MKKPKGKPRQRQRSADTNQVVGRETFAKISAVEGIRLSDEARQAFADFDARGLPPDERRRAIIGRFKRAAS